MPYSEVMFRCTDHSEQAQTSLSLLLPYTNLFSFCPGDFMPFKLTRSFANICPGSFFWVLRLQRKLHPKETVLIQLKHVLALVSPPNCFMSFPYWVISRSEARLSISPPNLCSSCYIFVTKTLEAEAETFHCLVILPSLCIFNFSTSFLSTIFEIEARILMRPNIIRRRGR